jgi:hypothetical protein
VLVESRRSEHGDAWPDEMQRAKPAHEITSGAHQEQDLMQPGMRAFEQYSIGFRHREIV